MAMAFVQGVSSSGSAGVSPQAAPAFASAVAVGDLIVVLAGGDVATAGLATGVTDSLGNTYTRVPSFNTTTTSLNLDAFYARVTNAGTGNVVTLTFNDTVENCVLVVQHFNGFAGTPTLDKSKAQANATSTTITSGASAVTTVAAELVVGLGIHSSTVSAISLGSGYTNLTTVSIAARQAAMESKLVAATGAQTATFTIAATRVNIGGVLTFYDDTTTTTTTTASTTTTTTTTTNAKIATLVDDFPGTTLNAQWDGFTNTGVSYSINNEVDFALTSTAVFASLVSHAKYDGTSSAIYYQLVDAGIQTWVSKEISFGVQDNATATNSLYAIVGDGSGTLDNINFYKKVAGTQTALWTAAFDAVNHAWQRIREAAGTTYFDTSPDGLTWTNRWNGTNVITMTNLAAVISVGHWGAETGSTTVKLDKVNVVASAVVATGQFFPFMGL